jgi:histidine ammonia-lyase
MLIIDGNRLNIEDVILVARHGEKVGLAESALERMIQSLNWVSAIIESGKPVYGINTGFGIFSEQRISSKDFEKLSRNLILSHAVSTGPELPLEVVKAAMLIRANTLAKGFSGVRPEIVSTLIEMLNQGITPVVPSQGSLGSSGDLASLSNLALVFTTDAQDMEAESGWAYFNGSNLKKMSGKVAMNAAGIPRLVLGSKEGLALINGATFSAAIAALAVFDAIHMLHIAEISLSMSLEALLGVSAAFDDRIHQARQHPGQIKVASKIRNLIKGSTLIDSTGRVQDAYSLRCAPQVQGAARDTVEFVKGIIQREINAATDNPLLFGQDEAISGGNFHGEPIGMGMDFLSIAMAEVAAISERRTFRLLDAQLNAGLPPMLVDKPQDAGINSGMMMLQYTAASLVLENQTLANSDTIHSLPTSAEQEDHNANSMTAARHTRQIIDNITHVLAIEIYCATRALSLRLKKYPQAKMGQGVQLAYELLCDRVPYIEGDAWWAPEIETVHEMVTKGIFDTITA